MWTPYDYKLAATRRDIGKCEAVRSSLESTKRCADSLQGNVSIIQSQLNECFGTEGDASSFSNPVRDWFESAISSLNSTIAFLQDEAASLGIQQRAYIARVEEAARERLLAGGRPQPRQ